MLDLTVHQLTPKPDSFPHRPTEHYPIGSITGGNWYVLTSLEIIEYSGVLRSP